MTDKIKEFKTKFVIGEPYLNTDGVITRVDLRIANGKVKLIEAWLQKVLKEEYDKGIGDLKEVNSLLRSAYQIAERNGEHTNWVVFRRQLRKILKKQLPELLKEKL